MKPWTMMMAGLAALILYATMPPRAMAGGVENIKDAVTKEFSGDARDSSNH
jgi:hypothetical protein